MANELKSCPFCGGTDLASGGDDKFVGYSCKTCQATGPNHYGSHDWNTRPAAPVEGLDTVGVQYAHEHSMTGRAMWGWQKEWKGCAAIGTRELVTRSQAEAIIAAERARYHALEEIAAGLVERTDKAEADNAALTARIEDLEEGRAEFANHYLEENAALTAKLETANALVTCCCGNPVDNHGIGDGHSPVDQYHYAMLQLEEQNAALTARVNSAEGKVKTLSSLCEEGFNREKALETQLAAARKAARLAHDTLIEINPSNYNHDDVCQLNDASVEAIFLLADILGETHGKTKEWWDERRAVLGGKS